MKNNKGIYPMAFSQQYKTKTESTLISHHASQRMNQRGIRVNALKVITSEGTSWKSKSNNAITETFYSEKDKRRAEKRIIIEIKTLRTIQKKFSTSKVDILNGMKRSQVSERISILKKELQKRGKLANKKLITAEGKLLTVFHSKNESPRKRSDRSRRKNKSTRR